MSSVVSSHEAHPLSVGKYIFGFVSSVVVTMAAYLLVTRGTFSHTVTIGVISGLAILQYLLQMFFFLHVGEERKPRWKLAVMVLMLIVVLIVVFGSLWIMNNLNTRMTPQQMTQYLKSQDAL